MYLETLEKNIESKIKLGTSLKPDYYVLKYIQIYFISEIQKRKIYETNQIRCSCSNP